MKKEEPDDRNYLRLMYLKEGKEQEELIELPDFHWRECKHSEFIPQAGKIIAKRVRQLKPEKYDWTFHCVPIPGEKADKKYLKHFLLSTISENVGRFNQAFSVLMYHCKIRPLERVIYYFYGGGISKSLKPEDFWLLPDGSRIEVIYGSHRSVVEGFLGLSELEMETMWVKVSNGDVYYHGNMTAEQYNVLTELKKQHPNCYRKRRV